MSALVLRALQEPTQVTFPLMDTPQATKVG